MSEDSDEIEIILPQHLPDAQRLGVLGHSGHDSAPRPRPRKTRRLGRLRARQPSEASQVSPARLNTEATSQDSEVEVVEPPPKRPRQEPRMAVDLGSSSSSSSAVEAVGPDGQAAGSMRFCGDTFFTNALTASGAEAGVRDGTQLRFLDLLEPQSALRFAFLTAMV